MNSQIFNCFKSDYVIENTTSIELCKELRNENKDCLGIFINYQTESDFYCSLLSNLGDLTYTDLTVTVIVKLVYILIIIDIVYMERF